MSVSQYELLTLRSAGVSLILDVSGPHLPRVLHWGADLGADAEGIALATAAPVPDSALDEPILLTLLPVESDGWAGTPGLELVPADGGPALRLRLIDPVLGTGTTARIRASDDEAEIEVEILLELDPHGVLVESATVRNVGTGTLEVAALQHLLPVPERAVSGLDLSGRWTRERAPQRFTVQDGTRLRASRRGRTGHDATLLLSVGTADFGFRRGEVWSAHVAWSGQHSHLVERLSEGAGPHSSILGGGELLAPGEVRLAPGETYRSPLVLFVYSDAGLDGISERLHRRLRARPHHPTSPRPVMLNTWEAVYFDHDRPRLLELARTAASIGVERFVLDDGWFGARRDDTAGLGDWVVSNEMWPDGLAPLFDEVRALGMEVGLWVEPEMVNLDSDLVRAHPEWVLGRVDGRGWRQQHVLDLTQVAAWDHILQRLDALVTEYDIDFLKWDHNRDLFEATSGRRPAVHAQTMAVYALLDELIARHPGLEVESCASGGARVDLGILERTHRVWASDCNDPIERTDIQLWTTLLLPPELVGEHVGPAVAHTTHRGADLSMRCATALMGHAGLEWDVTTCTAVELDQLRAWIALHKQLRPLLHSGDVVRADLDEPGERLYGVVAADRSAAVFTFAQLTSGRSTHPGLRVLPGLDPALTYRVTIPVGIPEPATVQRAEPGWTVAARGGRLEVSGAVLDQVGLSLPVLAAGQAMVLVLTAVS